MDTYSFTAAGQEYVAHEWLAAVLFHLIHRAGGVNGLILAKTLILALITLFLALAARAGGARAAAILPSLGLGLFVAASRFQVRPHLFSWLFTAVILWAWLRARRGGGDRWWLLLAVPLQALWASTHGGGVLGLGLLGMILAGEALEAAREGGAEARRRLAAPALAMAGGMAASLLNPYGHRVLLLPFRLTSMDLYMERIFEWQPPWHDSFRTTTMLAGWMVLACATAFSLLRATGRPPGAVGGRRRASPARGAAAGLVSWLPLALLGLFLALRLAGDGAWTAGRARLLLASVPVALAAGTLLRLRTAEIPLHLVAAGFMVLALQHHRAVAGAALVCAVILAVSASRRPPAPAVSGRNLRRVAAALPPAALAAAAAAVALLGYPYRVEGRPRTPGLGVARDTPRCAVDFIEEKGIDGHGFVSYRDAAMLIHRMHPAVRVAIDSRNDVYGEGLYRRYLNALRSPSAMAAFLETWPVDFFLLGYGDPAREVGAWLNGSGQWLPVFFDSRSFILVRRTSPAGMRLKDEAFRVLRPSVLGATRITASNASAALMEADRSIAACRDSSFGYFYRGKALMALGRFREALETARQAVALDPGNSIAWSDMGLAAAALGDRRQAIRHYRRALEEDPDNGTARRNLEILGDP